MIMQCDCKNDFQDERYGKNMRVHNPRKDNQSYRCTVCSKIKSASGSAIADTKKKK